MKRADKANPKIQGMEAVILDMDGVITQTARVHKAAWKEMFDSFLQAEEKDYPLTSDEDYIKYIDGKPRLDGIRSFLESRDIKLPEGAPDDAHDLKTVWGLGNKKNAIFLNLLHTNGVETYSAAIRQIKYWRTHGLKTAVVSSSKNCRYILEVAGIDRLFDVRIDGVTLQEEGIKGKPAPDMFIEAARRLGTGPDSCVVFEDAISGVQAGSNGNFALVVGVDRANNEMELYENGADIVVKNLGEIDLFNKMEMEDYFKQKLPSAFEEQSRIHSLLENKAPVLFMDYNVTLSPAAKHDENAVLSEGMKKVLRNCAAKFTVIIISKRDTDDIRKSVNIENCIYAGNLGLHISGPGGGILKDTETVSLYISDDITDVDTFKVVSEGGIGILVGAHDEPSAADYTLKNIYQVRLFLQELSGLKCN